jgi:hypothetical protein
MGSPLHSWRRGAALGLAAIVGSALTAAASQQSDAHLTYRPDKSVNTREGTFGVSGPLDVLRLEVKLENKDTSRSLVVDPEFFESIRWRIAQVGGEPDAVRSLTLEGEWLAAMSCGPEPAAACGRGFRITLAPLGWVTATLLLRPSAGPLLPGEYRMAYDGGAARPRLLEGDLTPWQGRFPPSGSVGLTIRPVQTPRQRADHHAIEAMYAKKRGDEETALAEFTKMAAAIPGDRFAIGSMGTSLLSLGRYAEAAAALEQALPPVGAGAEALLPQDLALAYVMMNEAVRAESILRRYYPPEQVAPRFEQARRAAANLKARR